MSRKLGISPREKFFSRAAQTHSGVKVASLPGALLRGAPGWGSDGSSSKSYDVQSRCEATAPSKLVGGAWRTAIAHHKIYSSTLHTSETRVVATGYTFPVCGGWIRVPRSYRSACVLHKLGGSALVSALQGVMGMNMGDPSAPR